MRWRPGKTSLKWIKGHSGIKGNEEADRLAGEGARKPMPNEEFSLDFPPDKVPTGASLASLEQRDLYRMISETKQSPARPKTEKNIELIKRDTQVRFGRHPTSEAIWKASRHKDLTRKTRDFLWKSTQHAYKIGEFWFPIEGLQERGICPICNEPENMEHILVKCKSNARTLTWKLANDLWLNRHNTPLPSDLGGILGCGLANYTRNNKPDKGKNRLYRIIVSETAFIVWKLRNERRIRDKDSTTDTPESEIRNRWLNAINKRLTIDRCLTDGKRFGKRALDWKVVKSTWTRCLKDEESLPTDWYKRRGVLVGISQPAPRAGAAR
jgi:hypothetical protein